MATVRMLPSYVRSGGYDVVNARVEVEYPTVGLGTRFCEVGLLPETTSGGETLDPREATIQTLSQAVISP